MNIAVMRGVMTRIGFSELAAQALVEEQGMDDLQEIKLLSDDEIESLIKVIRRPGGTIAGAAGAQVANPGVNVNQRAEGHLNKRSMLPISLSRLSGRYVKSVSSSRRTSLRRVTLRPSMPRIGPRRWRQSRSTYARF